MPPLIPDITGVSNALNNNSSSSSPDVSTLLTMLEKWGYVGFIGSVISVLWHIADACKEDNWMQRATVLIVSASTGFVIAPIAWFLTPVFFGNASAEFTLSVACVAAATGTQSLNMFMRKLKGYQITDKRQEFVPPPPPPPKDKPQLQPPLNKEQEQNEKAELP